MLIFVKGLKIHLFFMIFTGIIIFDFGRFCQAVFI